MKKIFGHRGLPQIYKENTFTGINKANEAKAICMECPVVNECLDYAIRTNQDSGIWGGTTEEERKSIRRHYRKTGLVINR